MTEQEILEGNKLIVEFAEFDYLNDFNYTEENEEGWYNSDGMCCGKELKFHSSWDWLMPVVERIELLGSNIIMNRTLYSRFKINHNCVKLSWSKNNNYQLYLEVLPYWMEGRINTLNIDKEYKRIKIKQETTKLEALYIVVVEFIKWYNQNK